MISTLGPQWKQNSNPVPLRYDMYNQYLFFQICIRFSYTLFSCGDIISFQYIVAMCLPFCTELLHWQWDNLMFVTNENNMFLVCFLLGNEVYSKKIKYM